VNPPPGAASTSATEPQTTTPNASQPREILGKTTQDVRAAAPELKTGTQAVTPKITAKDPITLSGNAYVVAASEIAQGNVKHTLDLFYATNGRFPKDYQEFRDEILKPGTGEALSLPRLPYYQEYGYDEVNHKLIILEYSDRKNQGNK
jgi:hypothetical protein